MPAAFTHYWREKFLHLDSEGETYDHTAGNQFLRRGVTTGDRVFCISVRKGIPILIGALTLSRPPVSREKACRLLQTDNLWEDGKEHLIGDKKNSSVKSFTRTLPWEVLRRLRFYKPKSQGVKALKFDTPTRLNQQTLRNVRMLTEESAEELERLLGTEAYASNETTERLPSRKETLVNRLQRDHATVRRLKSLYADICQICRATIDLPSGGRYSEAHHVRPLGTEHNGSDTLDNLLCVCPNCHTKLDYGCMRLALAHIRFATRHKLSPANLFYHNSKIYGRAIGG